MTTRTKNKNALNDFAQLLAQEHNLVECADILGVSKAAARTYLQRVIKKLGWQAQ